MTSTIRLTGPTRPPCARPRGGDPPRAPGAHGGGAGPHPRQLHFPGGALPPVDAFWSLTAYGEDMNLISNPAERYSVGDRSAGLRWDADGGLTIRLQNEPPDEGGEANWLPTAKEGAWFVALRMYRPRPQVIDASWECPPLIRVV
ncbi:DUF1214 domain-containing protein [Streptomyces sp. NPDC001123]